MKKILNNNWFFFSLLLNVALVGYVIYQQNTIKKIESSITDKFKTDNRILFIGNSIFAENDWAKQLNNPNITNLGIGGITSFEIQMRLNALMMGSPSKIFFEMGSNDINKGAGLQDIMNNFNNIIYEIRLTSPFTKVYILSILPVNRDFGGGNVEFTYDNDKVDQLNETVEAFCKKFGVDFVNANPLLKDNEGRLSLQYTRDGAHLTTAGYERIKELMKHYLDK
jgi:lysophospholipase L1-like esterase